MTKQEVRLCQLNLESTERFSAYTQAHDFTNYEAGIIYIEQGVWDDPILTTGRKIHIDKKITEVKILSYECDGDYFQSGVILHLQCQSKIMLCASAFPYMIYVNIDGIYSSGVPEYQIKEYRHEDV